MGVLKTWNVPSFSRERSGTVYTVDMLDNGTFMCDCPAWLNNQTEGHYDCKHIKAVRRGEFKAVRHELQGDERELTSVMRTLRTVESVKLFWYGNEWRVKYTLTDRDQSMTHLLAAFDQSYPSYELALMAYRHFVPEVKF